MRRSRERITPAYRRAAGIMVDVFYDHFLALAWHDHYPAMELETFSQQIYAMLQTQDAVLPVTMKPSVTKMIQEDWLTSYRIPGYISLVIDRIAKRMSRPELLLGGGTELVRCRHQLAEDFHGFFPEASAFAERHRQSQTLAPGTGN